MGEGIAVVEEEFPSSSAEELCRRAETAAAGDGAALMILTLGFTVPSHDHFTTSFCCLLIFIVLSDTNIMVAF